VKVVYNQINSDLDSAILLLNGYNPANKSHLNKNVAQGFKARVALTLQDWTTAANMAAAGTQMVICHGFHFPIYRVFNDYKNPEWIWGFASAGKSDNLLHFFLRIICPAISRLRTLLLHRELYRILCTDKFLFQMSVGNYGILLGATLLFPVPLDASGNEIGTRLKIHAKKI
jgi:hypothetical protein